METLSTARAHGGTQGVYRHASTATGSPMTFSVYIPPLETGRPPLRPAAASTLPCPGHWQ